MVATQLLDWLCLSLMFVWDPVVCGRGVRDCIAYCLINWVCGFWLSDYWEGAGQTEQRMCCILVLPYHLPWIFIPNAHPLLDCSVSFRPHISRLLVSRGTSSFLPLLWLTSFQMLVLSTPGAVHTLSSDSLSSYQFYPRSQPLNPHLWWPIFALLRTCSAINTYYVSVERRLYSTEGRMKK